MLQRPPTLCVVPDVAQAETLRDDTLFDNRSAGVGEGTMCDNLRPGAVKGRVSRFLIAADDRWPTLVPACIFLCPS